MTKFQDVNELNAVYSQKDLIEFRGNFLKKYSIREKSIRDTVIELLDFPKNKQIIDIGCGNCSFIKFLLTQFPSNSYYALDIVYNPSCVCNEIKYDTYDGSTYPGFDVKFDYVLLMHMLYHVEDFAGFFAYIKSIMAKNAKVIITTKSQNTFACLESIYKEVANKLGITISSTRDESHFCLENGIAILSKYFSRPSYDIKFVQLNTMLIVDDPRELLRYVFSTQRYAPKNQSGTGLNLKIYTDLWQEELNKHTPFEDKYIEVAYSVERRK